jgi:hypothetical protein
MEDQDQEVCNLLGKMSHRKIAKDEKKLRRSFGKIKK